MQGVSNGMSFMLARWTAQYGRPDPAHDGSGIEVWLTEASLACSADLFEARYSHPNADNH